MIDKELFNEGIKTVESELNDVKRQQQQGDKYKDVDGTEFQVFGALDDTYTYFFIANLKQNIVIRMQPKNAVAFLSGMKKVN